MAASKNPRYISRVYVAKYIDLKAPLLASMTTGKYTLYNDETQDISWTEQIAIFVAFEHRYRISKHYIVILPVSELVGNQSVRQTNNCWAVNKHLQQMNISLSDGRFFYMDTTNISSSEQSGLKRLLKHDVPLNWLWESRGSPFFQAPVECFSRCFVCWCNVVSVMEVLPLPPSCH